MTAVLNLTPLPAQGRLAVSFCCFRYSRPCDETVTTVLNLISTFGQGRLEVSFLHFLHF